MEGVAVILPSFRNCMRPGVKTKDGPGWRESRGESALANKSRCSLWKDRIHRAGDGLFSPFREHLFTWVIQHTTGFSSTEAAFALWSLLHRDLDAKCFGQMQKLFPCFVVLLQPPQWPHLCLSCGAFKPVHVLHCSEPASLAQSHCFCAASGPCSVMPVHRQLGGSHTLYRTFHCTLFACATTARRAESLLFYLPETALNALQTSQKWEWLSCSEIQEG